MVFDDLKSYAVALVVSRARDGPRVAAANITKLYRFIIPRVEINILYFMHILQVVCFKRTFAFLMLKSCIQPRWCNHFHNQENLNINILMFVSS